MQLEGARHSSGSVLGINLAKTIAQCVVVWTVFLWFIPYKLLMRLEMFAAMPTFASNRWSEIGLLLFMAASTIFVICVWNMLWLGNGTPWPWDRNTAFVVAGPYRFIRHPMVVAGVMMGLSSALMLGSYLGLVYVLVGFIVWNFILRPMEEADLAHRFGKPYVEYFQNVPAYLPKITPHRSIIIESVEEHAEI